MCVQDSAEAKDPVGRSSVISYIGYIGCIGCFGCIGCIGYIGYIGCIGCIGYIGYIGCIGCIGYIGYRSRWSLVSDRPSATPSVARRATRSGAPCTR